MDPVTFVKDVIAAIDEGVQAAFGRKPAPAPAPAPAATPAASSPQQITATSEEPVESLAPSTQARQRPALMRGPTGAEVLEFSRTPHRGPATEIRDGDTIDGDSTDETTDETIGDTAGDEQLSTDGATTGDPGTGASAEPGADAGADDAADTEVASHSDPPPADDAAAA